MLSSLLFPCRTVSLIEYFFLFVLASEILDVGVDDDVDVDHLDVGGGWEVVADAEEHRGQHQGHPHVEGHQAYTVRGGLVVVGHVTDDVEVTRLKSRLCILTVTPSLPSSSTPMEMLLIVSIGPSYEYFSTLRWMNNLRSEPDIYVTCLGVKFTFLIHIQ